MNTKDIFLNTQFSKSAISVKDLPSDIGSEISLCGRSNSGKSSVLNTLASNKKLAKASKTPGRTQAMNVFSLNSSSENRIIDLPGMVLLMSLKTCVKNGVGLLINILIIEKASRE